MTESPGLFPLPDNQEPFNIQRTLGRIEAAIVAMATDIHEAVAEQKRMSERLEADEKRLVSIEEWRANVRTRNGIITKVVLILLIPTLAWGYNTGAYVMKLVYQYEAHQGVKK